MRKLIAAKFAKLNSILRISIKTKLFLIILLTSTVVALAASSLIYVEIHRTLIQGLRNELTATARTAGASINGDKHKLLELSGNENSPLYSEIKKQLKAIRQANPKIRYVYTMAKTNKSKIWQFIVDAEDNPELVSHLGDKYDVSEFEEMQNAFNKPTADKELTIDKWGTWLSGYSPIYDSAGRAVAIVGIDMSAKSVQTTLAKRRRALAMPLLSIFLLPALISWIVSKRASRSLTSMIFAAKKIADGDYDQRIPVNTNDEIGDLARALNYMASNISKRVGSQECEITIDSLTDLYNHRYFQELLSNEIKRAERYNRELSLMIIDIDKFTEFNAINGHTFGDEALKKIAELIKQSTRTTDIAARYAGEEFVVMLPETSGDEAKLMAERINMMVSTCQFHTKHNIAIPLTTGIGIATYPKDGESSQDLLNSVYEALKEAKRIGRLQIASYSEINHGANIKNTNKPSRGKGRNDDLILSAVFSLAKAVDARDHYTRRHSEFVARYAAALGREIGLSEEEITNLSIAGLLHDIGKIGIPDSLLNKPDKLTQEEWQFMNRHPILGAEIIRNMKGLPKAIVKAVLHHHERYDGTGYPDGMEGEEIPFTARVLALADSFHAMISDRPYRKGLSFETAMNEIIRSRGKQFDPDLADSFIKLLEREQHASDDEHETPPTQDKLIS